MVLTRELSAFYKALLAGDVKPLYVIRTVRSELMGFETKLHLHQVRTRELMGFENHASRTYTRFELATM